MHACMHAPLAKTPTAHAVPAVRQGHVRVGPRPHWQAQPVHSVLYVLTIDTPGRAAGVGLGPLNGF